MNHGMPYLEFITSPSDNFPPMMLKCRNCGSINNATAMKKIKKGMWWWKKTIDACPLCNHAEFDHHLKYQIRNV